MAAGVLHLLSWSFFFYFYKILFFFLCITSVLRVEESIACLVDTFWEIGR